jgi:hypothetical protein
LASRWRTIVWRRVVSQLEARRLTGAAHRERSLERLAECPGGRDRDGGWQRRAAHPTPRSGS